MVKSLKPLKLAAWALAILLFLIPLSGASSYTFYVEPRDRAVEVEIKKPGISLERIYLRFGGQEEDFTLRIDELDPGAERIHDHFIISATGMQAEPYYIVFEVKLNKTLVAEKNIDLQTVALNIYDDGWKRLQAVPFAEDSDFLYYRAEPPKLAAQFALSGEPVPVEIRVTSPCNGNDVCEPERGEDEENCPDCISASQSICVPAERYCIGDDVFECSADGSSYTILSCDFGCVDGECLLSAPWPTAGMAVALDPVFVSVIIVMLAAISYLALVVRSTRRELLRLEERKPSNEDIKKIMKRER